MKQELSTSKAEIAKNFLFSQANYNWYIMYRTHTCGELRIEDINKEITLAGWVQRVRDLGAMTFIDLRDRYGITQLVADDNTTKELSSKIESIGREFVIQVKGIVRERSSKNTKIPTGEVEIELTELNILGPAETPPFTIQDDTDGGDELRMKYRYLDLRRDSVQKNMVFKGKNGSRNTELFK